MQEVFEKIIEKLEELNIEKQSCSKCAYREECDAMQEKNDIADDVCLCTMLMKLKSIEIVKQTAAEYNNGWIPVSERLPDKEGKYLVTLDKWNTISFADFKDLKNNPHFNAPVIAWQPLSPKYQPKGE